MYATNQEEAYTEIKGVLNALLNSVKDNVTVIYLDVEDGSLRKLGSEKLTNLICYEANMIKEAGFKFGLYTGLSFGMNIISIMKRFLNYNLLYGRLDTLMIIR